MTDTLFGSAPKASFQTQPTILPSQKTTLDQLLGALTTTGQNAVWPTAPGLTSQQFSVINPLASTAEGIKTTAPTAQQSALTDTTFGTQTGLLGYNAPKIDSTDVFQKSVLDPLNKSFDERTLPAIQGKYGIGAGGAYSSDAEQARRQAGSDLTATEANYGAQFAYDTSKANQTADIAGAGIRGTAVGATPRTLTTPNIPTASNVDLLNALLPGVNQTQSTGQAQADYGLKLLQLLLGGAGGTTQQTVGTGTGGSSGLLGGLLGGAVSAGTPGAGGVSLIGNLLGASDRRVKDDLEQVGEVDGFPLYKFRYKGEPANVRRLGLVAQDVERRRPDAVGRVPGTDIRTVDYNRLITDLLAA